METLERWKQDVRAGRLDVERLCDLLAAQQEQIAAQHEQIAAQQGQIAVQQQQLETAQQRVAELEQKLGLPPSAKVAEPFSLRAEEKRQEKRGRAKKRKAKKAGRRGRLTTAEKVRRAERTEVCYPEGVPLADCQLSHTRAVWRLEHGRAVLVAYHIYRGPKDQYGRIPGVLGRCEFGLELVVELAYLVYVIGLSFDKACQVMQFLQNINLKKSQADALLKRLARHWQREFDVLCTLLANSLIVHADETSWSINSVWALLSEKARLLLFGVHKDAETLKKVLDPATFKGLMITDDAAVYLNFTAAQKCWSHLLRKAIKLTLQEPDNAKYRAFADGLVDLYREACRVQRDGRLSDAGRRAKVAALEKKLERLCLPHWSAQQPPLPPGPANDFRLLVDELMRLRLDQQLFTFVTTPAAERPNGEAQPAAGTNNESERTLRPPAQARDTGRANKTLAGARRQTVVVSVLESLRVYLKTYTLATVTAEIQRWIKDGCSCFTKLLQRLKLKPPKESVLDRLFPQPSG